MNPSLKSIYSEHVSALMSRFKWLDGGIESIYAIPKNTSDSKITRHVLKGRSCDRRSL